MHKGGQFSGSHGNSKVEPSHAVDRPQWGVPETVSPGYFNRRDSGKEKPGNQKGYGGPDYRTWTGLYGRRRCGLCD